MHEVADIRSRAEGAMFATAAGDALGWPNEHRARRTGGGTEPKLEFVEWRRRDGGRYAAHEERIGAGEYSDDTQLVLAVARARSAGEKWWERLTEIELPFWLFYERGGGMATKRAARAWAVGKAPWVGDDRARYFDAGGNGVAMRILPHVLVGCRDDDFTSTARSVVRDGITTHGHPVALVGALAYAYALWSALRREGVLDYGGLITSVKEATALWSSLPGDLPREWYEAAEAESDGQYDTRWNDTVAAFADLLQMVASGMDEGALSVDREVLEQLGALDRRVSGAGTVSAATSVFLASRHASRPAQGLVAAAFAHGADTDTLAAMTGGLLGAVNGDEWLHGLAPRLQDAAYLRTMARNAIAGTADRIPAPRPQDLRRLWQLLADTSPGTQLTLPDGREAVVEGVTKLPTRTRHDITVFTLCSADGQTLFLKKVKRLQTPSRQTEAATTASADTPPRRAHRAVVAVEAADVDESVAFYRDLIGLELTRRTDDFVSFGGVVVIVPSNGTTPQKQLELPSETPFEGRPRLLVFVEADELEQLHHRLGEAAVPVSDLGVVRSGRRHFCCLDPDGTVVELREANGG